ncbi:hypothetical protein DL96DRAFT_1594082 [Flagelloscypha sp. PMI_526]|nr:hypothetical protein DL96DRAFT_1594082 [Flagelloscypha sp. PMI_526]
MVLSTTKTMPSDIRLCVYASPKEILEAIAHVNSTQWEWRLNLPLGLNLERIGKEHPLDHYVIAKVNDVSEIIYFRFHGTPLVLTPLRPFEELTDVEQQIEILAEWAAKQEKEVVDQYKQVRGDDELVKRFTEVLMEKLGWPTTAAVQEEQLRGSCVDKDRFQPVEKASEDDVLRKITLEDDIDVLAGLVHEFEKDTAQIRPDLTPLDELREFVKVGVGKGAYWGYFEGKDRKLAASCMLRRPTESTVALTMMVTGNEYRRRGYGAALTSAAVEYSLRAVEDGGIGKKRVVLFYAENSGAGRVYRRLGFVEGYGHQAWLLVKPGTET